MKFAYASRTGNVQSIIDALGIEALQIVGGDEFIDEDFILFTYTDGYGDVPFEVDAFLANHGDKLKGVVVSGDTGYGEAYGLAGDKIAEQFNVPLLYKVENGGTEEDLAAIKAAIGA